MRYLRRKKIYNSIKPHAIELIREWDNNEHAKGCLGASSISLEREIDVCNTLSQYAYIIERIYGDSHTTSEEWLKRLFDFY